LTFKNDLQLLVGFGLITCRVVGTIHLRRPHGRKGGVRLRWMHADGGGSASCGRPHRKLDPFDIMSYHAKKLPWRYSEADLPSDHYMLALDM